MTVAVRPALIGTPVLETERLVLRAPQATDFEVYAPFLASDRSRHIGGPLSRGQAWRSFCHMTGHWVHRGYGQFVYADRATGTPLGMCGPWFPEEWPEPEIGWTVWSAGAEGRGYAHEAALAARAFAFGTLGWTTAVSLIAPGNDRSEALARRLGCTPDGTFDLPFYGMSNVWRHPGGRA